MPRKKSNEGRFKGGYKGVEKELRSCGAKKRYPNKEAAQRTANSLMRIAPETPDLRVYECDWCGGWHLTKGE